MTMTEICKVALEYPKLVPDFTAVCDFWYELTLDD
jgi:hypothetical protein